MTTPTSDKSSRRLRRQDMALAGRLALPPLIVAALMLAAFRLYGIYPFGRRSVSWGDMSQQIVPLLMQYKQALSGGSLFYSLKAGGGMNMYGVFFYYLASPFTFLVSFVRAEDMYLFAGVLVMLKMSVCALTASLCFTLCRKDLGAAEEVMLAVMYPFCGFALLYYQILPWLDVMYLFPLLIIALERLYSGRGAGMYTAVMCAGMVLQYYLCAMLAVFVMLFSGAYSVMSLKTSEGSKKLRTEVYRVTGRLFTGSLTAALLTAFVWLPSFMQLRASAKTETRLADVISQSAMVPNLPTMLPLLMCSGFAAAVLFADLLAKRRHARVTRLMLAMLGLTLIPFLFEPINKLWHFGSYVCFPGRFAFISCFLMLYCCADALADRPVYKPDALRACLWGTASIAVLILFLKHSRDVRRDSGADISRYTRTLWGDQRSFALLLGVFLLAAASYGLVYAAYRRGVYPRAVFTVLTASVFVVESMGNMGVYMGYPAAHNEKTTAGREQLLSLAGRIDDGGFYRVKSAGKLYDNNIIGAMGYNTLGHYTSLTDSSAAELLRLMGYSAVGMEISPVGGTRLTDALFSVRYEINGGVTGGKSVYRGEGGYITRLPDYLPMGLLLDTDAQSGLSDFPADTDRTAVQERLSVILGGGAVERCIPEEDIFRNNGKYYLPAGTRLHYTVEVPGGERTIYFDCSDGMSTRFSEAFFGSVEVSVNGAKLGLFPTNVNNGTICLGDVDGDTEVELHIMKNITVSSFGVFSIDVDRLNALISAARTVGLTEEGKGVLSGSCELSEPTTCLLSLPYSEGLRVQVNGKRVPCRSVLSGLTAFDMQAGNNEITVGFIPPGLTAGLLLTAAGVLLLAARVMLARRGLRLSGKCCKVLWAVTAAGAAAVFAGVYVLPLLITVFTG